MPTFVIDEDMPCRALQVESFKKGVVKLELFGIMTYVEQRMM